MKVSELLTEAAAYDNKKKQLKGTTKEWMASIGVSKEDIVEARAKALDLPSYKSLVKIVGDDISTDAMKKNGSFVFKRGDDGEKYNVYANGQIRASSMETNAGWTNGPIEKTGGVNQTKLASPKPRLKHGDPVKSLVMIYDGAFKELAKKASKKK